MKLRNIYIVNLHADIASTSSEMVAVSITPANTFEATKLYMKIRETAFMSNKADFEGIVCYK